MSILVQKDGKKEKPVDVDGLYQALKDKMIKVLTKNAENNPEQEFVNSEPVQLMEKIEAQVIYRVTEINKHKNVPDNKVNKYEDTQRTNYMS